MHLEASLPLLFWSFEEPIYWPFVSVQNFLKKISGGWKKAVAILEKTSCRPTARWVKLYFLIMQNDSFLIGVLLINMHLINYVFIFIICVYSSNTLLISEEICVLVDATLRFRFMLETYAIGISFPLATYLKGRCFLLDDRGIERALEQKHY